MLDANDLAGAVYTLENYAAQITSDPISEAYHILDDPDNPTANKEDPGIIQETPRSYNPAPADKIQQIDDDDWGETEAEHLNLEPESDDDNYDSVKDNHESNLSTEPHQDKLIGEELNMFFLIVQSENIPLCLHSYIESRSRYSSKCDIPHFRSEFYSVNHISTLTPIQKQLLNTFLAQAVDKPFSIALCSYLTIKWNLWNYFETSFGMKATVAQVLGVQSKEDELSIAKFCLLEGKAPMAFLCPTLEILTYYVCTFSKKLLDSAQNYVPVNEQAEAVAYINGPMTNKQKILQGDVFFLMNRQAQLLHSDEDSSSEEEPDLDDFTTELSAQADYNHATRGIASSQKMFPKKLPSFECAFGEQKVRPCRAKGANAMLLKKE